MFVLHTIRDKAGPAHSADFFIHETGDAIQYLNHLKRYTG